jgi:succinate dehydrogenase / fumarate reductase cytochrome b subunit
MGKPATKGTKMADVKRVERPLSPHLQIYRPQLTSITSILTRITGNGLIVGTVLAVWWLLAAATSAEYFAIADAVATSWFGDLVFTLSAWALWYHYLAGLRHLVFDAGKGLDIPTAEKLGWGCIIGSVVLTILTVIIV